jgi:hypothetical protein
MPVNNLDALREKRKGAIAHGVQIIDSRRLPLFICTESAEEPTLMQSRWQIQISFCASLKTAEKAPIRGPGLAPASYLFYRQLYAE